MADAPPTKPKRGLLGRMFRSALTGMAKFVGSMVMRRLAGSTPITTLLFAIVEQVVLSVQYRRKTLPYRDFVLATARNLGATSGSVLGAVAFAALLSVVPILGTILGVFVGSFIGSIVGGEGLKRVLDWAWDEPASAGPEPVPEIVPVD